jgi:FtsZ-binding cell division protein ZapB
VWQQIWIGHPWIFYRRVNGSVEISDYSNLNLEDFKDIKAVHTLPENELAEEVKKIRRVQNNFTEKVRAVLTKMNVANADDISKVNK